MYVHVLELSTGLLNNILCIYERNAVNYMCVRNNSRLQRIAHLSERFVQSLSLSLCMCDYAPFVNNSEKDVM